jgi:coproporphyrinogen III oxidase-like Fe-S oxidoreductase
MILEAFITGYLKRIYSQVLRLTDFGEFDPPDPEPGKEYLIYVHVPFCEELCPYCSFNRVPLEKDLAKAYFRALSEEIRMYRDRGFTFHAVYVGGGTPTVLPEELAGVLDELREYFPIREISVETNPNHLTDKVVGRLRDAGVNRLSVGVQSFDDSLLKAMERFHKYGSGAEIRERLERYNGTFDTLNADMIFNFPTQTERMLERDLQIINEIGIDQVTFYPLMVSDVTRRELGRIFGPISYRQEKLFYRRILDGLGDGYTPGTAWCFSRRKSMIDEYIVDYDEYVGIGSGAFGYVRGAVLSDAFSIPSYIDSVRAGRFPLQARRDFSDKDRMRYEFVMKLFGTSLDMDRAEDQFRGRFRSTLRKEITFFRLVGALVDEGSVIRLTRKGQYLWVIMMREFFTGVNNFRDACRIRSGDGAVSEL